jgi:hypothetical protein
MLLGLLLHRLCASVIQTEASWTRSFKVIPGSWAARSFQLCSPGDSDCWQSEGGGGRHLRLLCYLQRRPISKERAAEAFGTNKVCGESLFRRGSMANWKSSSAHPSVLGQDYGRNLAWKLPGLSDRGLTHKAYLAVLTPAVLPPASVRLSRLTASD